MNQFFIKIRNLLKQYTLGQNIVIIVVLIGILSSIIALVIWANRPEYEILYSDLDPSSAGKIVNDLRGSKIKYKLDHNGRTIYVPSEKVAELRLQFTESGYVGKAVPGYEIFDDAKIGMTTFMQRLNMRRALEGELVRTINQFPEVKNSRIHLVFPEEKLFGKKKKGSAAAVLYVQPGKYLGADQVRGIAALIANSVDGIEPKDVVVVDSDGKVLSESQSEDAVLGSVGNRWDLRNRIEAKLQQKVTGIVESIVGESNAVVEVSVDLNFEQINRTMETIDPDNVVVISEESHTESTANMDTSLNIQESHKKENTITNYELNKTVEHFVSNTGTIDKISVAVVVNGINKTIQDKNGKTVNQYVPWSNRDLEQITALVKSSVGFNEERGDIVTVQNLRFDNSGIEADRQYFVKAEKEAMWAGIINKSIIGIGLLVVFILLRNLLKTSNVVLNLPDHKKGKLSGATVDHKLTDFEEDEDIPEDLYIKKLSPEARAKLKAKNKMTTEVIDYTKSNPDDAAKLIRTWLTNK
jgi:flagellar M-ring protein FliF